MRKYISLGIFSASSLALEVALTQLLSTLYYPPFVFVVLSLAVFGIALGAAIITLNKQLRDEQHIPLWIAISSVAVIIQTVMLPFAATLDSPIFAGILLLLPYIGIGITIASIFTALSEQSQILYAYDLVGAGLGAVLIIPLMNIANPLNAMLLIAVLMLAAGWLYSSNMALAALVPLGLIFFATNVGLNFIAVDMTKLSTNKPIQSALAGNGEIVETRWDAFARTDLVSPTANQPPRIYVDGAAASVIPPAQNNDFLLQDIGLFAFATANPDNVFIIGSGGGLDVWFGLRVGARDITAVEVNPNSIALVNDISGYTGDIYNQPAVRVLVDEGRSVLNREDTRYDLIYLSQVVTLTAERSGYALTENAVFTVEAFEEYWAHLSDEGYIALKLYDEQTLSRSLSIVIELLKRQGLTDQEVLLHTVTLLSPSTSPPTPLLIVRNTPFTPEESASIGRNAQAVGFASLYLPHIQADAPLDTIVSGTATYADVITSSSLDLSAPTDNRPFFYQFEKGIPSNIVPLLITIGVILVAGIITLAVIRWRMNPPQLEYVSLYFAGLGAGFMLLEFILIQTTHIYIGHPTIAITVILAALLMGGGIGSAIYHRMSATPQKINWRIIASICFVLPIWYLIWQPLSAATIGMPIIVRIIILCITILPLAALMGIPFALGLRLVGQKHPLYIPLAWAINGIFTVIGTVLGVVIALLYGYLAVLIVGVLCYVLVLGTSRFIQT